MNQEINFLAEISSPFKRTLVIRQRIHSLAGENEIALKLKSIINTITVKLFARLNE